MCVGVGVGVLKCVTDPSIHFQGSLPVGIASFEFLLRPPPLLLTPTPYRTNSLTSNTREISSPTTFPTLIFSSKQAQNLHINISPARLCENTIYTLSCLRRPCFFLKDTLQANHVFYHFCLRGKSTLSLQTLV